MMEKKILVIEDQKDSIQSAFDFANMIRFSGELKFDYISKSQNIPYAELRDKYQMIFVDITLADKSQKNGYGIIMDILHNDWFDKNNIIVLTGNSQVREGLEQNGITESFEVVFKPTTFQKLIPIIEKYQM